MHGDGAMPPGRRSRRFLRSKRTWGVLTAAATLVIAIAIPATSFADNASGCDFAANGTTQSCSGPLSGSTFAGGDGNLLTSPTAFGTTDWQNVAGRNTGIDLTSGSGDNAFGQGTKEDNASVSVVSGSIPPNKSDLTRFYEASEFASNSNFLYLAWERTNNLGSANMDFEINQKTQPDLTTAGPKTLNRTAGDLLVTFDFTNGGGTPTLGLLRWVTSGSTSQCFASNSLPCWGNHVTLNGTESIGAVNNLGAVTDPFQSGTNNVGALRFGETAINLTAAGVFPPGTCEAFGSAFLKSRASASFGSEVKDFVAPVPVSISNCGQVTIIKHTQPRGVNQDFSYKSDVTGTTTTAGSTPCPTGNSAFTLNDNGNTNQDSAGNTQDCFNVPSGSYTVIENGPPPTWVLDSLTCSTGGHQDAPGSPQADITVTPGSHVTCTYVNKQQLGAIKITKTGKDKNCTAAGAPTSNCTGAGTADLPGGVFSIKSNGTPISASPVTTGNDGTVCVDHLPFGTYSVQETSAPNGYAIDDTTAHDVSVTTNSTCGDGNEATFSANDTPLTDISANASSEVVGATNSTIKCVDSSTADIGTSPQGPGDPVTVTANGLKPGTYTCTIVIDP
jgi:hypothetical protein